MQSATCETRTDARANPLFGNHVYNTLETLLAWPLSTWFRKTNTMLATKECTVATSRHHCTRTVWGDKIKNTGPGLIADYSWTIFCKANTLSSRGSSPGRSTARSRTRNARRSAAECRYRICRKMRFQLYQQFRMGLGFHNYLPPDIEVLKRRHLCMLIACIPRVTM